MYGLWIISHELFLDKSQANQAMFTRTLYNGEAFIAQ